MKGKGVVAFLWTVTIYKYLNYDCLPPLAFVVCDG